MEIELSNGQLKFWQWDTEQKVKVPENVPTVHFKFGSFARGFPVADRWVKVPDELLQTGKDILLWTYKEDHTLDAARIPVEKKPKPAGYAYTPTEIKTWEALDKRIEALEKGGGVAGVSSVNGQTGAVTITASGIGAATPDEVTSTVNSAWAEAQKTLEPLFDAKQPKGDYITQDGLQTATNAALAQAKASGEFDGAPGAPGAPGADGYSPTVTVEQTDTGATITTTDQTGTTTATIKNGSPGTTGASGTTPHIGDNGNWYLGDTDTGKPSQGPAGAGLDVTGATVGQTVKISAVDSNGVPTAWVPVDMASGGGEWNTIVDTTLTESAAYNQEVQLAGYHEVVVCFRLPKVDSAIQLGNSYSPVGQAGLYYGKIGTTAYPWVYRSHAWCDADGNIIDSIIVTGAEGGIGVYLNIMTQATSQKKISNRMKLDKELPAGTQIWIKAR